MNKIIKTIGLTVALSGAVAAQSINAHNQNKIMNAVSSAIPESDVNKNNIYLSLIALGVLGAAVVGKKVHEFNNIPYEEAHRIIDFSENLLKNKKISQTETIMKLMDYEYQLESILKKTKIYDSKAAAEMKFAFGAIRHSYDYGELPEQSLYEKTKYLFDKAVSPKRIFKSIKKQYEEANPNVNFNVNYGRVTEMRAGSYVQTREPILYNGLRDDILLRELKIMEDDICNETKSIPFYKHDKINLLKKVNYAKDLIKKGKIVPSNLITEINDLYHLQYLRKTIAWH